MAHAMPNCRNGSDAALIQRRSCDLPRVALEMADGSIVAGVIEREQQDRYVLRDASVLVVGGDDTTVDTTSASKTLVVRVHPLGRAAVVA